MISKNQLRLFLEFKNMVEGYYDRLKISDEYSHVLKIETLATILSDSNSLFLDHIHGELTTKKLQALSNKLQETMLYGSADEIKSVATLLYHAFKAILNEK